MTRSSPDLLILSYDPDRAAAEALARACATGAAVSEFNLDLLDQALQSGMRCAVIWSDPRTTLAAALRDGAPPTLAAARWTAFAKAVLARSDPKDQHANRLILIDGGAVLGTKGTPGLGAALPFLHPLPLTNAPDLHDTAALLAHLMLPHLPDLHAAWLLLRAASLSATLSPLAQADLDQVADHGRAVDRALRERNLLRDQLHSLAPVSGPVPAADATGAGPSEIALLRDQLRDLAPLAAGIAAVVGAPPTGASAVQTTEIDLLRAQLVAVGALRHSSDGTVAQHPPTPAADPSDELRLLRAHMTYLQSDLALGGDIPDAPPIPAAPQGFEATIARLLADLVHETERRILAEREVQAARRTLRHLGVEPPSQPGRSAVAPRPQANPQDRPES